MSKAEPPPARQRPYVAQRTKHDYGMGALGEVPCYGGQGGASRFFYCSKASKAERNHGLEQLAVKPVHRYGAGLGEGHDPNAPAFDANHHPTVKALKLCRYLCKLITPPNGSILDPFTGSGSIGVAAIQEGFRFYGIELSPEYADIANRRLATALADQPASR